MVSPNNRQSVGESTVHAMLEAAIEKAPEGTGVVMLCCTMDADSPFSGEARIEYTSNMPRSTSFQVVTEWLKHHRRTFSKAQEEVGGDRVDEGLAEALWDSYSTAVMPDEVEGTALHNAKMCFFAGMHAAVCAILAHKNISLVSMERVIESLEEGWQNFNESLGRKSE